jgi:hypothetical protein
MWARSFTPLADCNIFRVFAAATKFNIAPWCVAHLVLASLGGIINVRLFCTRQAIPNNKKYLSTGPETRRKRSVCSRASKCDLERVSYYIFFTEIWAFENRHFVWRLYSIRYIGKSNTHNLPALTDLTNNPYGKKPIFFLRCNSKIGLHGWTRNSNRISTMEPDFSEMSSSSRKKGEYWPKFWHIRNRLSRIVDLRLAIVNVLLWYSSIRISPFNSFIDLDLDLDLCVLSINYYSNSSNNTQFSKSCTNSFAVFVVAGRSFIGVFVVILSWNVAAAKEISTLMFFKICTILRNMLELDYTNIHGRCCSFSAVLNRLYSCKSTSL